MSIAAGPGSLVMVGGQIKGESFEDASTGRGRIWRSSDGRSWTDVTPAAVSPGSFFVSVEWTQEGYLAIEKAQEVAVELWRSTDGRSWLPGGDRCGDQDCLRDLGLDNLAVLPDGSPLLVGGGAAAGATAAWRYERLSGTWLPEAVIAPDGIDLAQVHFVVPFTTSEGPMILSSVGDGPLSGIWRREDDGWREVGTVPADLDAAFALTSADGRWLLGGGSNDRAGGGLHTARLFWSTDLRHWKRVRLPLRRTKDVADGWINELASAGRTVVAAGIGYEGTAVGVLLVSTDAGRTWRRETPSSRIGNLADVLLTGRQMVAAGTAFGPGPDRDLAAYNEGDAVVCLGTLDGVTAPVPVPLAPPVLRLRWFVDHALMDAALGIDP